MNRGWKVERVARLKLLIGAWATSAESLQVWLAMREAGLGFETSPMRQALAAGEVVTPPGEPPVLLVDEVPIWEPLAIAEFLAEHVAGLWPTDARARALARSVVCEMHGGLRDLQMFLPFDLRHRFPPAWGLRGVRRDIARVLELWRRCREGFGVDGPFLFGHFSLADAMHAPLAARLLLHSVPLPGDSERYVQALMSLPSLLEWVETARRETTTEGGDGAIARDLERAAATEPDGRPSPGPSLPPSEPRTDDTGRAVKPIGTGTRRRH